MPKFLRWIFQGLFYTLFCFVIMFYSTEPEYNYLLPGYGELKLAFKHSTQRKEKCVKYTI